MRTVAVMQPYLYPYAGYFRLMAASDIFVIFDDVQFPRRGRVHRCEIEARRWLTLPLVKQPRDCLIKNLAFAPDARATLDARLDRARIYDHGTDPLAKKICDHLYSPLGTVADFLEDGLRVMATTLDLDVEIVRSSTLAVDPALRAQDRVIAIVQALGGDRYINAPGGRNLYSEDRFRRADIDLRFLPSYSGDFRFLLPALMTADASALRLDIMSDLDTFSAV